LITNVKNNYDLEDMFGRESARKVQKTSISLSALSSKDIPLQQSVNPVSG
jgi:hypothetical protein